MPEKSSEPVCAISDRTAKERGLKLGDTIEVAIGGENQVYKINAICAPSGSFYGDSKKEFTMVVPYDYMETIMNSGGRYNYMTAETSESDSVKAADNFNDTNERVKAISLTDLSSIKEITRSAATTFYIMFAIVCIICCIIIHGAFKLIINERMTVIGTFMSQGATRKKIEHILLCESFLYSVFGAIFGVVLGTAILYVIARETSPLKEYGIYMSFSIDPKLIIIGIIFAVLMSVISAFLPARSVRKLPVKDVILDRMEVKQKKENLRFILGIALLMMLGAWIIGEIGPFGGKCLVVVDGVHQYLPFFSEYQDKLKNLDTLQYTMDVGMGNNFISLWSYYLSSPFNLCLLYTSPSPRD